MDRVYLHSESYFGIMLVLNLVTAFSFAIALLLLTFSKFFIEYTETILALYFQTNVKLMAGSSTDKVIESPI